MRPRFSIVIPAYNAASTLDAAIRSVRGQDYDEWELLITDDGSTDATPVICDRHAREDPRVRYHTQPNAGTGAAITAAVDRATGEFVVQLGADDQLLPNYCSATSAFIESNPGYDIYASNVYRLTPRGRRTLYHTGPRFAWQMSLTVDDMLDACLIHVTAAFRREWFHRVGGFHAHHYNEDYDFWLRIMMAGARHIYQPVPLAVYRVSPGQKTQDGLAARLDDISILEEAIDSGGLTGAQVAHARRTIALLEQNVAFRERVLAVVGPRIAPVIFRVAHKAAWLVRPHRWRR